MCNSSPRASRPALGRHRRRLPLALAAAVPLIVAACGVPISAEDLALTPEPTAAEVAAGSPPGMLVSQAPAPGAEPVSAAPTASAGGESVTAAVAPTLTPVQLTPSPTPTASPRGPTPTPRPPPPTPEPPSGDLPGDAVSVLNRVRAENGRAALRIDPALMAAAAAYARLMADYNWFLCGCDVHRGPDASQPEDRIAAAGYRGRFRGEALAAGQGSGRDAVYTWLGSGPHAGIALDQSAVDVGIGHAFNPNDPYRHYWVLVTGIR